MSRCDDLLAWVSTQLRDAEISLHNGDATARRELWSREEPLTVFGAAKSVVGRNDIDDLFSWLEGRFSDCTSFSYEIVAADVVGDMGYTVCYEHVQATVAGQLRTYTLRATQIYRREGSEWRVVHRHGDSPPGPA